MVIGKTAIGSAVITSLSHTVFCSVGMASDTFHTFTVMQLPSWGQQLPSVGSTRLTLPEQEHFMSDSPPVPNSNSISTVNEMTMFAILLISACKNTK